MIIKRQKVPTKEFCQAFYRFCIESKPYDFCSLASRSLRKQKIEEYLNLILLSDYIFVVYEQQKIIGAAIFNQQRDSLVLEFVFATENRVDIITIFHKVLIKALQASNLSKITSTIQRRHRLKAFIRWVKKHDFVIEFLDDHSVIWTYERLCRSGGNK